MRTVNLGQPWRKIEERVKEIVKGEGWDEWRWMAMKDKRWNRLERGLEGDCSLLCRRSELAEETGAGALIINFLLILLWIEMKL